MEGFRSEMQNHYNLQIEKPPACNNPGIVTPLMMVPREHLSFLLFCVDGRRLEFLHFWNFQYQFVELSLFNWMFSHFSYFLSENKLFSWVSEL